MTHAADNPKLAAIIVAMAIIVIGRILTAKGGKLPFIRRIPGLNAVDEAIGRATEMGQPVIMVPGLGSIGSGSSTVPTLQAMNILGYIARSVAKFGNRIIVPTSDAVVTGIAEEVMRDAYPAAGRPELFRADDVRYLSSEQFAFASGVAGILSRERVAASFLFGPFYAEALIIAEVGRRVGAVQIAGTSSRTQIPFFIATCDYVIIGDEFYAAGAYLSKDPVLIASIVAQDYCKLLLLTVVVLGIIAATVASHAAVGSYLVHLPGGHVHTVHYKALGWMLAHWAKSALNSLKP